MIKTRFKFVKNGGVFYLPYNTTPLPKLMKTYYNWQTNIDEFAPMCDGTYCDAIINAMYLNRDKGRLLWVDLDDEVYIDE